MAGIVRLAIAGSFVIEYTDPFCAEIHFVGIVAAYNDQFTSSIPINEGMIEIVTGFVQIGTGLIQ